MLKRLSAPLLEASLDQNFSSRHQLLLPPYQQKWKDATKNCIHLNMASAGRDRSRAGARPIEAGARAASNVMRVVTSLRKGYHVSGRHNPGVARRVFAIERDEPRLSFRIT